MYFVSIIIDFYTIVFFYLFDPNSKGDITDCSQPKENFRCKDNWNYEDCGQLKDTKYKNYGCKHVESEDFEFFSCTNRMDKENVLFSKPPLSTKRSRKSKNYNLLLNFDENTIYCGKHNFTYAEFEHVYSKNPTDLCTLKEGKRISLEFLFLYLLNDYSFNMSTKMDEY